MKVVLFLVLLSVGCCFAISPSMAPHTPRRQSLKEYQASGEFTNSVDHFEAVRSVIDHLDEEAPTAMLQTGAGAGVALGAKRVRSFCEICILIMQMKQRGQPHLCAGLNALHYVTCIENLESILRADKAVVYWLKNGCMHMDSTGPEIVRPCPALPICSWIPNLFASPPSLVRDGVESLCPKNPKFLPTIPNEYKTLLQPQTAATPGPAGN